MALQADLVAPGRRQLGGIHDCPTAHMRDPWTMAALTNDTVVSEGRLGIKVGRTLHRRLHPARVAVQTTSVSRKVKRNLTCGLVAWRHIPRLRRCVPVHWRLEQKTIRFEQVCST